MRSHKPNKGGWNCLLVVCLVGVFISPVPVNLSTAFRFAALGADRILLVKPLRKTTDPFMFDVLRTYRGTVTDSEIIVRADNQTYNSFRCEFTVGEKYLILLDKEMLPFDSGNECGTVNCLQVVNDSVDRYAYDREKGRRSLKQIEVDLADDLAKLHARRLKPR